MSEKLVIRVADIKTAVANGTTRLKNDKNYHEDRGSIEEMYNLTPTEVRDLFKEESLKGVRTVPYTPKRWTLVDEDTTTVEEVVDQSRIISEVIEESITGESVDNNVSEAPALEENATSNHVADSF